MEESILQIVLLEIERLSKNNESILDIPLHQNKLEVIWGRVLEVQRIMVTYPLILYNTMETESETRLP